MNLDLSRLEKWRLPGLEAAGGFVAAGVAPVEMRRGLIWVRFSVVADGPDGFVVALAADGRFPRLTNVQVKHFMRLAGFKVEREATPSTPPVRAFVLRDHRTADHHLDARVAA